MITASSAIGLITFVSVALGAPSAPPPTQITPSSTVNTVTVTAERRHPSSQRQTQALIDQFSDAASGDGRIARWADPVCPWVGGLTEDFGGFIRNKIEGNALAVGALAGGQHCDPNILILFTPSPDALAALLAKTKRFVFIGEKATNSPTLDAFLQSKAPVRVYRTTGAVSSNGGDAGSMSAAFEPYNSSAKVGSQSYGPRQFAGATGSLLYTASDTAFLRVIMIVDSRETSGLTAGQVSDYLSLLTLGDVHEPKTAFRPETIANLFIESGGVDALTSWDRSYLKALYAAGSGARNRGVQTISMASYLNQH